MQQTNIIDDVNHKYTSYCGSAGALLIVGHYVFSCTLQNVDELEKVEFNIGGYNVTIRDYWSATVRVTIQHHCSGGINIHIVLYQSFALVSCTAKQRRTHDNTIARYA